ncbi:hypothetical protein BC938DRAFT_471964, partial [Jimgerdemannia flammicorona]
MIAGLGEASHLVVARLHTISVHYRNLIAHFETQIRVRAPLGFGAVIHGEGANRIPNTCNFSVVRVGADTEGATTAMALVKRLLEKGVTVGKGAACHTGVDGPSATLLAMQVPPVIARSAIRFSVGRETKVEDVDRVVALIWETVLEVLGDAATA